MLIFILFLLLINVSDSSCQLVFSSLRIPNKESSVLSSRSNRPQSTLNNYHYPYYKIAFNDSDAIPDEQRLMSQLLRNYDPSARPVYNASNTVSVAFGIALTQLSDMVCDYKIY
jgi:hypothetical protein